MPEVDPLRSDAMRREIRRATQGRRCGGPVEVDDYAEMVDRQFDDFCDDCADEQLPDEDVPR